MTANTLLTNTSAKPKTAFIRTKTGIRIVRSVHLTFNEIERLNNFIASEDEASTSELRNLLADRRKERARARAQSELDTGER